MQPLFKAALGCLVFSVISFLLSYANESTKAERQKAEDAIVADMKAAESRRGYITETEQAEFDRRHKEMTRRLGTKARLEQNIRAYFWLGVLLVLVGTLLGVAGHKEKQKTGNATNR